MKELCLQESVRLVYRIIVPGIPRSSRARSRHTWMSQVASIARTVCTTLLQGNRLQIEIAVYYTGLPTFDNDNVLKPICDALEGICYNNDHQISRHLIERHPIQGYSGRIQNPSTGLLGALAAGRDFVYIELS